MAKRIPFNPRNFGMILIYSYLILAFIAFLASQLNLPAFRIGFGFLLVIASVAISLIATGVRDFKIEKNEIFFFILVIGTLFGIFFITKHYIPEIFSLLPESSQELQSTLTDKIFSIFN